MVEIKKNVKLNLEGLNGNGFCLIGAFRQAARRQGWSPKEIDVVTKEATSRDYDHLLSVLVKYTESESAGGIDGN